MQTALVWGAQKSPRTAGVPRPHVGANLGHPSQRLSHSRKLSEPLELPLRGPWARKWAAGASKLRGRARRRGKWEPGLKAWEISEIFEVSEIWGDIGDRSEMVEISTLRQPRGGDPTA